ncbi:hypothetical protein EON65_41220 [archaeon]|nr:MAG: hypothetical protein EON65_41220 [archaeon]
MTERSQLFLDHGVEFRAVCLIFANLGMYLNAQRVRSNRIQFLVEITDNLCWWREKMDILCNVDLGARKYEELGGTTIYFSTEERYPMDPVVSLIKDAQEDPLWKPRIAHFALRLQRLLDDCILLDARSDAEASAYISILQDYVPRLKALAI